MKKIFITIAFITMLVLPNIVFADVYVQGYTKNDGTYVQGHYRSSPNGTTSDNYSTKGNINPYTGEYGTK